MAIKRTEFEADHSSHFITQIKMSSLIPSLQSRLHGVVRSKIQEGVFLDLKTRHNQLCHITMLVISISPPFVNFAWFVAKSQISLIL